MTEPRAETVQTAIEHLGRATGCEVGAVEYDRLIGDLLAVIENRDAARQEAWNDCPITGHDAPVESVLDGVEQRAIPIRCPHCAKELLDRIDELEREIEASADRERGWKLQAQQTETWAREAREVLTLGIRRDGHFLECPDMRSSHTDPVCEAERRCIAVLDLLSRAPEEVRE